MTTSPAARTFQVRHVQLTRAAFAAIAAIMVTFSPDHSAEVGLSVFSGFAIATGLIFVLAAWLVYPTLQRWPALVLGAIAVLAGMIGGIVPLRSDTLFFTVVITWALVSGLVEAGVGWSGLRRRAGSSSADAAADAPARTQARDAVTVGILTVILALALLLVPTQYSLQYTIADANVTFTLTGIIIGVGLFGGYAAIVAVYLAIAGFSPAAAPVTAEISSSTQERGAS